MARPESNWQLLLVADDGRIIPFRHVKGFALTLVGLLVLFGLASALLGWQFAMEKARHRQNREKLADVSEQAAHFKSEHERRTAELVLVKARLEQFQPSSSEASAAGINKTNTSEASTAGGRAPVEVEKKHRQDAGVPSSDPPVVQSSEPPAQPAVALGNFEVLFDVRANHVTAQFRVQNTGPRSDPVEGRCVVVLKTEGSDPVEWFALPDVPLSQGQPDGSDGNPFRISRYIDMTMSGTGPNQLSRYTSATVFVFDHGGDKILEKQYHITPPGPLAVPPADVTPNEKGAATDSVPATSGPDRKNR